MAESSSPAASKKQTPFGLPNIVILIAYCFVVLTTGMALGAADPMQELLKMNHAFPDISNEQDRNLATEKLVGVGLSFCVLSGAVIGPFMQIAGTKITALIGLFCHTMGYILFFFTNNVILQYIGSIAFGFAFQLILNSHMNIGALYPGSPNLICSIIGSCPDISYFIPLKLLQYAKTYGVQRCVSFYLLALVLPAVFLDLICTPMGQFRVPEAEKPEADPEKQSLMEKHGDDHGLGAEDIAVEPSRKSVVARMSAPQQIVTFEFLLFLPYFIISFLRKKHMAVTIRSTFMELDSTPNHVDANYYADFYSSLVPYGFIPAIVWGGAIDIVGITSLTFLHNAMCVAYILLATVPVMAIQGFTVCVFILCQSFVFGHLVSYIAMNFGFDTMPALQGFAATVVGVFSCVMDIFWGGIIVNVLGSYRNANFFIAALSLGVFVTPVLMLIANKRNKRPAKIVEPSAQRHSVLDNMMPPTNCYDRNSIESMKGKAPAESDFRA